MAVEKTPSTNSKRKSEPKVKATPERDLLHTQLEGAIGGLVKVIGESGGVRDEGYTVAIPISSERMREIINEAR